MKKHLIKKGRTIIGFVGMNNGQHFFAFGRPSQSSYMAFHCKDLDSGIAKIKEYSEGVY